MKILLILILVLFNNIAFSAWDPIHVDKKTGTAYFLDVKHIIQNKEKIRLWMLEDYEQEQIVKNLKYLSLKIFAEFNCSSSQIKVLAYSVYQGNMGEGEILFSKGNPIAWEKILPNSVNYYYMNLVCDSKEGD